MTSAPDIDALVATLRKVADPRNQKIGPSRALYSKAADALTSLQADLEAAREALKPFAEAAGYFDGHVRDDDLVSVALRNIRARDVRAAVRALTTHRGSE